MRERKSSKAAALFAFLALPWAGSPLAQDLPCGLDSEDCNAAAKHIIATSALSGRVGGAALKEAAAGVLPRSALTGVTDPVVARLKSEEWRKFDRALIDAEVPDCLHADGLKRQPTNILFINFTGVNALPFVLVAKLRGKCK